MNGKRILISPHARFEMQRRGLRTGEVLAVVRQPDQVLPSRKGREIRQSRIGLRGRMLLRAVGKEESGACHVVTAYKTSKVAKYWKTS